MPVVLEEFGCKLDIGRALCLHFQWYIVLASTVSSLVGLLGPCFISHGFCVYPGLPSTSWRTTAVWPLPSGKAPARASCSGTLPIGAHPYMRAPSGLTFPGLYHKALHSLRLPTRVHSCMHAGVSGYVHLCMACVSLILVGTALQEYAPTDPWLDGILRFGGGYSNWMTKMAAPAPGSAARCSST